MERRIFPTLPKVPGMLEVQPDLGQGNRIDISANVNDLERNGNADSDMT